MDIDELLAWGLPSLGLLLWAIVLAVVLPRALRRALPDARARLPAVIGLYAGLFAIGLWLWAVAMPLGPDARALVVDQLESWFWGTVVLLGFVIGASLLVRRVLRLLTRKATATRSTVDDTLVRGLRRPAHVLILFAGFVLWVEIVPAPEALVSRLGMVGEVVLIVMVALFADGILSEVVERRRATSRVFATAGTVLRAMARIVIYVVAALMLLATIGIAVTPIVASLGVGSLAIGLALQSTLEDFIAGLLIAADQPVTIGDHVAVADRAISGTVDHIGWRTTRVLTLERTKVIVPNSVLAKSTIVNYSRPLPIMRFQAAVGVDYDSDLGKVARVVHEVASHIQATHPHTTRDFVPEVLFVGFGASSVDLKVWIEACDWLHHFNVHDAFIRELHARFRSEGIVIPYPVQMLELPPEVLRVLERMNPTDPPGPPGPPGEAPR